MSQFITIHRAPGLTEEEFAANAPAVLEGKHARFVQSFVNLLEGFIVTVYEADDKDALEREFERLGFPFDEMHEVQLATTRDGLAQLLASQKG